MLDFKLSHSIVLHCHGSIGKELFKELTGLLCHRLIQ